jgi:hypothetical protein
LAFLRTDHFSLEYFPDALQPVSHEFFRWAALCLTGDINAGVSSIDCEKWCYLRCVAHRVIVAEIGEGQEAGPVVLLVVDVCTKVLLKGRVDSFGLPVCLRVVSCTEFSRDAESLTQAFP